MKTIIPGIFYTLLIAFGAGNAAAATYTVSAAVTGLPSCASAGYDGGTSVTPTEAYCGSSGTGKSAAAAARAGAGNVGISGRVSIADQSQSGSAAQIRASAGASFSDQLSFGNAFGTLRLPIDLAGSIARKAALPELVQGVVGASIAISNYGVSNLTTGINVFDVPIIDGYSAFSISMAGRVSCIGGAKFSTLNTECFGSFDYLQSARVLGVSVFDADGEEIVNPLITSTSGFDYLSGLLPHEVSPIPLPASSLLLIASLLALGGIRYRKLIKNAGA